MDLKEISGETAIRRCEARFPCGDAPKVEE
jgi:hypothetical protein